MLVFLGFLQSISLSLGLFSFWYHIDIFLVGLIPLQFLLRWIQSVPNKLKEKTVPFCTYSLLFIQTKVPVLVLMVIWFETRVNGVTL